METKNIEFLAGKLSFQQGAKTNNALETKNIGFPGGKCTFWKQKMVCWKHENAKYWFSYRKMKVFEGTSGDKQKCVNALETKNIDFPA